MSALLSAQDWARLLKLLMMYPAVPKHSENAFLRARCHEGLGDRETACAFLEDAVRLEPDNVGPRMLAIMLLSQIGDHEGALALAQPALLNRDKAHPKLLIAAAKAMFNRAADRLDEAAAREDAAEVCRILENALPRHSALAANERLKALAIDGFAHLAMSRHVLGDVRGAEAALSRAFDLDPANPHLLKLRRRLSAGAATSRELRETAEELALSFSDAA
jgi:tetratricopeptide (TPR) repeat protein